MKRLIAYLNDLTLRGIVALQVFAATEPVRLRAALTSILLALGVLIPALASQETAQSVAGVIAVVLPLAVGESARKKVTPTDL
ncbi:MULTISPECIES: hypothetical protein [unclassified Streptomyces]|uniref:hypothetical protein n=1 Tax=unclassified Streptomyces TaxID=2593676 RepID=UPI00037FC3C9|nr:MULTISPECIES: hypothetical protein [unclassified Streptomyces]MYY03071.1 hypothetical protein [Streptomyces sp. SID4913]